MSQDTQRSDLYHSQLLASPLGPSTGGLFPEKPLQVAQLSQPLLSPSDCLVFQGHIRQREQLCGKDEENGEIPVSAFSRTCFAGYQGGQERPGLPESCQNPAGQDVKGALTLPQHTGSALASLG